MRKILRSLGRKGIYYSIGLFVLLFFQVYLDLKMPDYMREMTQLVLMEQSDLQPMLMAGGKMLACALGSMVDAVVVAYLCARLASEMSYELGNRIFTRIMSFGAEEIAHFSTASLITRSTNDITNLQMYVAFGLQGILKAPIMVVWALTKIIGKSWELSLVTLGAIIAIVAVVIVVFRTVIPKFRVVQEQVDDLNLVMREHLTGLKIIRAFNAEQCQEEKFQEKSEALKNTQLYIARRSVVIQPLITLIMSVFGLSIFWIGATLINNIPVRGPLSIMRRVERFSDIMVFSSYAMQLVVAFMMLVFIFMMYPRAQVSADRINEVLDSPIAVKDGPGVGKELVASDENGASTQVPAAFEFNQVSFRYPEAAQNSLSDLNFTIEKGSTVAFVGATGSGKTTLVNLAARLYDPTEGEILLDGCPLKDYEFSELYTKLAIVAQTARLFSGTVEENLDFGTVNFDRDEEDWLYALEIAQAKDFVLAMPGGLKAELAQSEANLSGGQKQRLSIARAIARKPEIIIFDDCFSALDYKTDEVLRHALKKVLPDATFLIVAQRIGTIHDADCIFVLDEGHVVGQGTHEELLENNELYREIALSQASPEKAAEALLGVDEDGEIFHAGISASSHNRQEGVL